MGPIAPYARLGSQAEAAHTVKVWKTGYSNSPNACHEPSYDNEGNNLYCPWNRDHVLESAIGFFWWNGSVTSWPWEEKTCSVSSGILPS